MAATAAAPHGKDGSPPSSVHVRPRAVARSSNSKDIGRRASSTPNDRAPDNDRQPQQEQAPSPAPLPGPPNDGSAGPDVCRCSVKCDGCGNDVALPVGYCASATGESCPSQGRGVASLTPEEAEALAELNRNKYSIGYVRSTRRAVMILAAVHWGLFGFLYSRCKNTGECDDLLHVVQFVHAIPNVISFVFYGAILFGTAIWMSTFLDVSVHLVVGVVRFSRWLLGRDQPEVVEPPELTTYITTELNDQRTGGVRTTVSSSSVNAQEGAGATDASVNGAAQPGVAAVAADPVEAGTSSGNERHDDGATRPPESASWFPFPTWLSSLTGGSAAAAPSADAAASQQQLSREDVPTAATADNEDDQVSISSSLAVKSEADAGYGSNSISLAQTDDKQQDAEEIAPGGEARPNVRAPVFSPHQDSAVTRISHSATPLNTSEFQAVAAQDLSDGTSIQRSGLTSRMGAPTPRNYEALAAATAAQGALLGYSVYSDQQAGTSSSATDLAAEISTSFMSYVRKSGQALHDALFWNSNNEERPMDPNQQQRAQERPSPQRLQREGPQSPHSRLRMQEDPLRGQTAFQDDYDVHDSDDDVDRRFYNPDLRDDQEETLVDGDEPLEAEAVDILPDQIGTKHSDATAFEREITSASYHNINPREQSSHTRSARHAPNDGPSDNTSAGRSVPSSNQDSRQVQTSASLVSQKNAETETSLHQVLSAQDTGSARGRRIEEMKVTHPSCVRNCNAAGAPAGPATYSADFAVQGSSVPSVPRNVGNSESSARNTSALEISCKCESAQDRSTPVDPQLANLGATSVRTQQNYLGASPVAPVHGSGGSAVFHSSSRNLLANAAAPSSTPSMPHTPVKRAASNPPTETFSTAESQSNRRRNMAAVQREILALQGRTPGAEGKLAGRGPLRRNQSMGPPAQTAPDQDPNARAHRRKRRLDPRPVDHEGGGCDNPATNGAEEEFVGDSSRRDHHLPRNTSGGSFQPSPANFRQLMRNQFVHMVEMPYLVESYTPSMSARDENLGNDGKTKSPVNDGYESTYSIPGTVAASSTSSGDAVAAGAWASSSQTQPQTDISNDISKISHSSSEEPVSY